MKHLAAHFGGRYSGPSGERRAGLQLDRCVFIHGASPLPGYASASSWLEVLYGPLQLMLGRLSSSSLHIACMMSSMACGGPSACIHRPPHVAWCHEDVMRCQLVSHDAG